MAAGLGFKTFTTGEVLTAGDVNGYLMQGINVFATTTARNAAITAPQEGQFAFTKDTNSLWYYDGAAWVASGATGDIEGVTAGVGISGGGTSGTVTVTNSMATAIDAKGDLVPGTGADTFARLAVGANNTVLTADSAEATGLKWATPASGGMTQIASTSLSGSATTVSSIPATYKTLLIVIDALSTDTNAQIEFTVNSNTSGYAYSGTTQIGSTSATYGNIGDSRIRLSAGQSAAASAASSAWALNFYNYASTAAVKTYDMSGFCGGSVDNVAIFQGGAWRNTSAITSCTVTTVTGNFDGGTITVYGVN